MNRLTHKIYFCHLLASQAKSITIIFIIFELLQLKLKGKNNFVHRNHLTLCGVSGVKTPSTSMSYNHCGCTHGLTRYISFHLPHCPLYTLHHSNKNASGHAQQQAGSYYHRRFTVASKM